MTLVVATAEGPLEFSDALIDAVARRADFVAALTAETIRAVLGNAQSPEGQVQRLNVPAGFLLDLGAVLVLEIWERHGITAHLDAGLPTWREADADLARRLHDDSGQFERANSASLNGRVLRFWVENFAWDSIETFGCDIVLNIADEEAIVDAVARFLWTNRNALQAVQLDGVQE